MAFCVERCPQENCDRLLYVIVVSGDQTVWCMSCGGVSVFTLKCDDDGDGKLEDK